MAFHLYEDTWETTTTTGTSDYALAGAVTGWRPFSAQYAEGDTTWYSAFDGVNFEHGIATYHASTNTLTRGTVLRSTNGGAAVAWAAGTKQITVAPLGVVLEKIAAVPLSAQLLDLGTRLVAVGTKLNAQGPVTTTNFQSAASTNTALDGALNYYAGASPNYEWDLPVPSAGMCLQIMLAPNAVSTIRPSATTQITAPGNISYTNAAPIIIPVSPKSGLASITLTGRSGNWDILSVSSEVSEAMGWMSRPMFEAGYSGGNPALTSGVWSAVTWLTPTFDTHGWGTGGGAYAPKRPGKYFVSWNVHLGDVSATPVCQSCFAGIFLNGAQREFKGFVDNAVNFLGFANACSANAIIAVNGTTDSIQPYVQVSGPAPVMFGIYPSLLNIFYLGP